MNQKWCTVKYSRDYRDPSGIIHYTEETERVIETIATYLTFAGVAEIVEDEKIVSESVAIGENSSDNVVMATSQAIPEASVGNVALKVFVPSPQQEIVFDFVEQIDQPGARKHAVVIAVAGAGKTTTLIECFKRLVKRGKKVIFLAFNNKIMREIRARIEAAGLQGKVEVKTFHSCGMGLWMRANEGCKVEGEEPGNAGYFKFDRILHELETATYFWGDVAGNPIPNMNAMGQMPYIYKTFVRKAWTFARQALFGFKVNLMDKEAWLELVEHFDLEDEIAEAAERDGEDLSTVELQAHVFQAINWTVRFVRYGMTIAREVIDFEDMIYMPLISQIHVWQKDAVLVDEAQDTNPSRREFVAKLLKPNGMSVWVGDPAQSIYGFTGADSNAIDLIKQRYGAIELPLTVTYRCPKQVVAMAQQWVSHIQAHESAPDGELKTIPAEAILGETLRADDAILCRNTKPLVELCLALIRKGVACHVEGRDLGTGLVKLVTRWKSVKNLDQLVRRLEEYRDREVQKAMSRGKEFKAELVADQVETLLSIISDMPRGSTLDQLEVKITGMFLDEEKQFKKTLTLSTIHRAKGREWKRVFWYGPARFQPSKYARQEWQMEQEKNLMYVAVTRSMASLVTVNAPNGALKLREVAA